MVPLPCVSIRIKKAAKPYFYIVIPKKELKRAIDRNVLKRRIKSIFQQFPTRDGLQITCFVKKEALKQTYVELQGIIQSQL